MNTLFHRIAITVVVIVAFRCQGSASAATVTFILDQSVAGEFELFAGASLADNFGLASYGVPLTGSFTSLDHNSPSSLFGTFPGFGPAGFTSLRSPDNAPTIHASQDTITPTPNIIFGFGQTANSFRALGMNSGAPQEQPAWGAPLLIARGACSGPCRLEFARTSVDLFANVFRSATGNATMAAQLELVVINVPEPASAVPGFFAAFIWFFAVARASFGRAGPP